jgi:peroxiredoxin
MNTLQTMELGPHLTTTAPDFQAPDHTRQTHSLSDLMGKRGLLLCFVGDIWQPASMRRIIWLQRHAQTFIQRGVNVALLIRDDVYTVYGFYVSSPSLPTFPLLADKDGKVHGLFNMAHNPGLVLLDHTRVIREKWLMPDERVWPKIVDLLQMMERL